MSRELLELEEAAARVHMGANELRHAAQRGEVEAIEHNGEWRFPVRQLDEWAQRSLLAAEHRALKTQHQSMVDAHRRAERKAWRVAGMIREEAVDVAVGAKAKAGILRDMTDLAGRSGMVYDPDWLFKALVAREEAASTAIGGGVALLHPRFNEAYVFEETFVAYGRCERPVFFGATNGEGTRHFFLICATDPQTHLKILARLAVLAHDTDLVARLDAAPDAAAVVAAVMACEDEVVG